MKKRKHAITFTQPTLTRPSFGAEVNINNIVARFTQTGMLPPAREPKYGDAPDISFHEAACVQAEIRSKHAEGAFAEKRSEAPESTIEENPTPDKGSEPEPDKAPEAPDDERSH